ncbi:phosphoribosylformylglycinamidine cyclo-ligase [Gammaproteobacteria bacterium]|nr:phosphoribosylformylglycinamidine cyclo-ligase [Gammaproteobacteria bacterium]
MTTNIDYKSAGVDIAAGNESVNRIKKTVKSTFSKAVLTDLGGFGSLYDLKSIFEEYEHPVMVQSIDGVGTKTIVARMMNKFDTLGIDLVSSTANDIIVLGAKPLTLLDYIANDKLNPETVESIVTGMAKACKENNISLVGGETAEMPGTYLPGEIDLVGVITGVVEKDKAIQGKDILPGDIVLGFASNGLHTNGYSLARKLCFEIAQYSVDTYIDELQSTIGEALLKPHINYARPVLHILDHGVEVKGMAHITGGGLLENIPRILPSNCSVNIDKKTFPELPIFSLLKNLGELSQVECFKTFNMGIGMIMVVKPNEIQKIKTALLNYPEFKLYEIGEVVQGEGIVSICE